MPVVPVAASDRVLACIPLYTGRVARLAVRLKQVLIYD
jgi:hypothetical protein